MKYFFFFICLLFISCEKKSPNNYGFYYWRTVFSINKTEKDLLQKSTSKDFYIRIFDLDKKEGNISKVGVINFKQKIDFKQNVVPLILSPIELGKAPPKMILILQSILYIIV